MAQKPVYTYVSVYGITACLPARVPLLTASVAGLFIFSHIIYIPLSPFAGSLARDRRARRTHRVLYNRQKVLHFCVYILYIFGYLASRAIYLFLHLRRRPAFKSPKRENFFMHHLNTIGRWNGEVFLQFFSCSSPLSSEKWSYEEFWVSSLPIHWKFLSFTTFLDFIEE